VETFGFGADLDHDPDPGIYNGILPLRDRDSCKNFASNLINKDYYGVIIG